MDASDFLELNLMENNDYAGHWDVPLNDNFGIIDAECDEIATELLVDPSLPYDGKLRGSRGSLEDRLNNAMDMHGNVLYNSYDLEKSRHSRKPWTVPSNISDRIAKLEEDSYVSDRLKYSLTASGGAIAGVRYVNDRSLGTARQVKRFDVNGVDLQSIHYRSCSAADFSVDVGTRTIDVPAMGFMQISGIMFNHTIPFTHVYSTGAYKHITMYAAAYIAPGAGVVDCQNIRNSTVTGVSGVCSYGASTFTSVGIGAVSGANNDWQPAVGQLLRIFDSVNYHDYTIASVAADSVDISGVFEFGDGVITYTWEIFDFTQPVFYFTETLPTNETIYQGALLAASSEALLTMAVILVDAAAYRVSFPSVYQNGYTRYKLLSVDFSPLGHLGGMPAGSTSFASSELEDLSAASIKSIHVIVLEKYLSGGFVTQPRYFISIDPVREITVSGFTYYAHSYQTYIAQISTGAPMDRVVSPGSAGMTTNITIEHPDYGDVGGLRSYWTSLGGATDKTLEYLGILIELL